MTTLTRILFLSMLFSSFPSKVWSQTSSPATNGSYDYNLAAQRMNNLKRANSYPERVQDLIKACEAAAQQQDANTLALAVMGQPPVDVMHKAFQLIGTLSTPLQKSIFMQILQDDEFWELSLGNPWKTDQLYKQQIARKLISGLLGRDLRLLSKDYDPDFKKQIRAEHADPEPKILNRNDREQAARELLRS